MKYQRVHILGGAGSGKTTLARAYASKHGLCHYELDDFYYSHAANRTRRSEQERSELMVAAASNHSWVIDGIFWQSWVLPAAQRADKIIVLAVPEMTRHRRVISRHISLLKQAPLSEYPRFFPTLFELLIHNRSYNKGPLQETLQLLQDFEEKVVLCSTNHAAAIALGLNPAEIST